jgi:pimeloyl-ACP methyl ester carboxylesterase
MKRFIVVIFFTIHFACEGKNYRNEITYAPSEDTTIAVKISYPEKRIEKEKIVIWSTPSRESNFYSDSTTNKQLELCPVLRNKLLESGHINIEYIGRNDSIIFHNRKYSSSNIYTKVLDLESVLSYINKNKELANKKIVLIGHSEGGDINCVVGSKNKSNIVSIVQLASAAQPGKDVAKYQREQNFLEITLLLTRHGRQDMMDSTTNKMSSLDSYHKADSDGANQFFKENIEPVEDFIYQFDNNDSIYYHINLYLQDKWKKENEETKIFWRNNFENYYQFFAGNITPQQIAIRTFDPEKYYPLIKCPVLAVQGTNDKRVDCYPNVENMERLLVKGGNRNFEKMILEGYNHSLVKGNAEHEYIVHEKQIISMHSKPDKHVEDSVISKIIEWIDK